MASKGIESTPLAFIGLIQDNLRDRYRSGWSVIKELIQNADDARATRLEIGWIANLPNAKHPLLNGPGLFVINDGPFTTSDARAIHFLGLSNKAAESNKVGKFGLGLKSVFHVCEAFFYLANGDANEDQGASRFLRTDIYNPWSSEDPSMNIHPEWDVFPAASQEAMLKILSPLLPAVADGVFRPSWFCLWLPLRRRSHCNAQWAIAQEYPGETETPPDWLIRENLATDLSQLLPMLTHLQSIRCWRSNESGELQQELRVAIAGDALRCRYRAQPFLGRKRLCGFVTIEGATGKLDAKGHFSGIEENVQHVDVTSLPDDPSWPWTTNIDVKEGFLRVKEKAEPHCAVVITRCPSKGSGCMMIRWAVFLPVGDEPAEVLECSGESDYTLTLHGYYFVDAGRSEIQFPNGDGVADIRHRWNEALSRSGTLRLIIPALKEFIGEQGISDDATSITRALQSSALISYRKLDVTSEQQWLCRLTPHGGRWDAVPAAAPIYPLQEPASTDLLFRVLPAMSLLCEKHTIGFLGRPSLRRDDDWAQWPAELVLDALENLDTVQIFRSRAGIESLSRFIEVVGPAVRESLVSDRLTAIARTALRNCTSECRRHREMTSQFLQFVPASRRFPIHFGDARVSLADRILKALLILDTAVLPLPRELDSISDPGVAEIDFDNTVTMLTCLGEMSPEEDDAKEFHSARARAAYEILDLAKKAGFIHRILDGCDSLRLFPATDYSSTTSREVFSIAELREINARKTLFTGFATLARSLQSAVKSERVVHLATEPASRLFDDGVLMSCNFDGCLKALSETPSLSSVEDRVSLLQALQTGLSNADASAEVSELPVERLLPLRYLLHGNPDQYRDNGPLLASQTAGVNAWARLAGKVLQATGEEWRLLEDELVSRLPRPQWPVLGVRSLDAGVVVDLLNSESVSPTEVDCVALTADDRERIIRDWPLAPEGQNDAMRARQIKILCELPLHADHAGRLASIDQRTFWQGSFTAGVDQLTDIRLLRLSDDPMIAARQRDLARVFDPTQAIAFALAESPANQRWQLIMDAIQFLGSIPIGLQQRLRDAAWTPLRDGTGVSPSVIIDLKGLADVTAEVIGNSATAVGIDRLDPKFLRHAAYHIVVRDLLPSRGQMVTNLGRAAARLSQYRVGEVNLEGGALERFVTLFADSPRGAMPAWRLLQRLCASPGLSEFSGRLVSELNGSIDPARLILILNFLSARYVRDHDPAALTQFNEYLAEAAQSEDRDSILSQIRLCSRKGTWRPASELALDDENIDPDSLLAEEQGRCIFQDNPINSDANGSESDQLPPIPNLLQAERVSLDEFNRRVSASTELLRRHFRPWQNVVPQELLGAMFSIMGDDKAMTTLAQEFLGPAPLQGVRMRLRWNGKSLADAMRNARFVVRAAHPDRVESVNLLRQPFQAPVAAELNQLFDGVDDGRCLLGPDNQRAYVLWLRPMNCALRSPEELIRLVRQTTTLILYRIYGQRGAIADDLLEELVKTDQLDTRIAQNLILDAVFFLAYQLGFTAIPKVRQVCQEFDAARRDRTDAELSIESGVDAHQQLAEATDRESRTKKTLRNLIVSDPASRQATLAAVQRKILDFQYEKASIPFELFQNADDATAELREMSGKAQTEVSDGPQFVVWWDKQSIRFAHWGRPINKYLLGTFDGRSRGFDRDLEKMLVFSASDKSIPGHQQLTTGKFGLGFKSVFLMTDAPRVVSGRRARFQVLGGIYPEVLSAEEFERMHGALGKFGDAANGTLIELQSETPITEGLRPPESLSRFLRLLPVLLVFSRLIKKCRLGSDEQGLHDVTWAGQPLVGIQGMEVGRLSGAEVGTVGAAVLAFRGSDWTILLGRKVEGLAELPEVPPVWVTAPTSEGPSLGLAVNGPFDLDVGRCRLAPNSPRNQQIADRIGQELGLLLCRFFDKATKEWASCQSALGLGADIDLNLFCRTLWNRFVHGIVSKEGPAAELVSRIFYGSSQHGVARLFAERTALPTGLTGRYDLLTRSDRVLFHTSGLLEGQGATYAEIGAVVGEWPNYRSRYQPGCIVSGVVANGLKRICPTIQLRAISLSQAITEEVAEGTALPATAASIGQLVDGVFMTRMRQGEAGLSRAAREDYAHLRRVLDSIRFRTRGQSSATANELLVAHSDLPEFIDERRRAAFAPSDRILFQQYAGPALSFFRACRTRLAAGVADMINWAFDSSNNESRKAAVLQYLRGGELRLELGLALRARGIAGTWLADLEGQSSLWNDADANEKAVIRGLLGIATDQDPVRPIAAPRRRPDPGRSLQQIHGWWMRQRDELLPKYLRRVYPTGIAPTFALDKIDQDPTVRHGWMVLLMLGAMHTMGRTKDGQNRHFLTHCQNMGWMHTFSRPVDDLSDWMTVLEQYLRDQVQQTEYFFWMGQFMSIFQCARWLPEYAHAFMEINKLTQDFRLDEITQPSVSVLFQGTGIEAPPISRALGLGACFVVRELTRLGVIRNSLAHRHCYVPSRRVRQLMSAIEGQAFVDDGAGRRWERSIDIHSTLRHHLGPERCHFDLAFDIPLQLLAEQRDLQAELLHLDIPDDDVEDDELVF